MTFHRTPNSDAMRLPSSSQESQTYRRLRATLLKTTFCELMCQRTIATRFGTIDESRDLGFIVFYHA